MFCRHRRSMLTKSSKVNVNYVYTVQILHSKQQTILLSMFRRQLSLKTDINTELTSLMSEKGTYLIVTYIFLLICQL